MKKIKAPFLCLLTLALCVIAAIFCAIGSSAGRSAQATPYKTHLSGYDIVYDISENRKIAVTEDITVSFYGNAGMIRSIPTNGGEMVKHVSVKELENDAEKDVPYDVYDDEDGFLCVDVGDNNRKYEEHTYRLKYDYCLTKAQEGNDMLALTPVGNGWGCVIEDINIKLILPDGYIKDDKTFCYVDGYSYGGDKVKVPFKESVENQRTILSAHVDSISSYTEVRFDIHFKDGALSTYTEFTPYLFILINLALLLLLFILKMLVFNGRQIIPVVNFEAPDGMDPLLLGKLIDNTVNSEDIAAMIFYWADKGYVKIDLTNEKDPSVIRIVQKLPEGTSDYETLMYANFFAGNDVVQISSLKYSFYNTVEKVRAKVDLKAKGLYTKPSLVLSAVFAIIAGLLLGLVPFVIALTQISASFFVLLPFAAVIPALVIYAFSLSLSYKTNKLKKRTIFTFRLLLLAGGIIFALIYAFLVPSYLMGFLPKLLLAVSSSIVAIVSVCIVSRTEEYTKQLNQILGFKQFITFAEKDRLEKLIEENPEYYYHVLPYAQVMGVSDIWEDKFKGITVAPPSWATSSSSDSLFDFIVFNSLMRRSFSNMGSTMAARPPSSGSSGHGGGHFGGFGGGGHGGGGGGFR